MNSKKILFIFILFFFNQCQTVLSSFDSNFAVYQKNQCNESKKSYGCYFERYITADGVRIGVKKEENKPFSNSVKVWKDSIIHYLEESGYEILESKTINNYEVIKSRIRFKEDNFIYGIAFKMDSANIKEIYVIEFAGLENHYKKYEKEIYQFVNERLKKK